MQRRQRERADGVRMPVRTVTQLNDAGPSDALQHDVT